MKIPFDFHSLKISVLVRLEMAELRFIMFMFIHTIFTSNIYS